MITREDLTGIVEQVLADTDHFLVGVEVRLGGKANVEVDNDRSITLGELAEVNKSVRARIEDLGEDCELQVSSPGMGNPFKVPRQYAKHTGRLVQVQLVDGKNLTGMLDGFDAREVVLRIQHPSKVKGRLPKLDTEPTAIPFDQIVATKASISFNHIGQ